MSGRVAYGAHDLGAVDRFVGRVALALPPNFRREMDAVVTRHLSGKLPPNSARELQDLVSAQVALTLRASDYAAVMEREAARERDADKVKSSVRDIERLDQLRRKYSGAVSTLEAAVYDRRASIKELADVSAGFTRDIEVLDEYERRPLQAWADRLIEKGKRLRRRVA